MEVATQVAPVRWLAVLVAALALAGCAPSQVAQGGPVTPLPSAPAGVTATPLATPTPTPTPRPTPTPTSTPVSEATPAADAPLATERAVQERVNQYRTSRDLKALAYVEALAEVARRHSQDMAERGFFAHENPDGQGPQDRVEAAGLGDFLCAENLYMVTNARSDAAAAIAEEAFTGWRNSPGHHENMVGPGHDAGGVGVVVRPKLLPGDAVPQRYDIYVTHLLCRDISAYNRLLAQYRAAEAVFQELEAEYGRLKAEYGALQEAYRAVEERYRRGEVSYAEVEAAYRRMEDAYRRLEEARGRLNAQVDLLNALAAQVNAAAEE